MHVAIYARVSTERQERQQTIDSQLAALRGLGSRRGTVSSTRRMSSATRATAAPGSTGPASTPCATPSATAPSSIVAVLSPDRLARRYAYQVLLLEEFRRPAAR